MTDVVWIESQSELESIVAEGGRVVIDFSAPAWCRPCQQFEPHYERAAANATEIKFLAVDVDKADWALLEYGVRSVPTVKLYENGTFVRDIKAPQGALPFINDVRS